jgi:hypothetical protein
METSKRIVIIAGQTPLAYTMKILILIFGLIAIMTPDEARGQQKVGKQNVIGRVIAKDAYLGLFRLGDSSFDQFVVELKDSRTRKFGSRYINVRYENHGSVEDMPEGLFNGGENWWSFSLTRDESCDKVVSEKLFVLPNASKKLPDSGSYILLSKDYLDLPKTGSLLPCFLVKPGGIKTQDRRKKV